MSFGWPRRWPPTPAVPAFHCFARLDCCRKSDSVTGAFSNFAGRCFTSDDEEKLTSKRFENQKNLPSAPAGYPPPTATPAAHGRNAVGNPVDKWWTDLRPSGE